MNPELLVTAGIDDTALTNLPPGKKIFGTVKLSSDEDGHPFGQWSGVLVRTGIEGAPGPGVFRLTFMSSAAPAEGLEPGAQLQFYRAPLRLATLQVVAQSRASALVDRDIVLMPSAPARDASEPVAA